VSYGPIFRGNLHELKCWPEHFKAIVEGAKVHELRMDDRGGFDEGDVLHLREYVADDLELHSGEPHPMAGQYTSHALLVVVMHVTRTGPWMADGMVCMSIRVLK